MSLLLKIAQIHTPNFFKKRELAKLFDLVASAFRSSIPPTAGLSFLQRRALFAQFTQAVAEQAVLRGDNLPAIQQRLYRGAYEIGANYRSRFKVSSLPAAMTVSRLLYRSLGIDFRGHEDGGITICRCFFSDYYSAATCQIISALDAGLIAGLAGSDTLTFSQRITEGHDVCQAQFLKQEWME